MASGQFLIAGSWPGRHASTNLATRVIASRSCHVLASRLTMLPLPEPVLSNAKYRRLLGVPCVVLPRLPRLRGQPASTIQDHVSPEPSSPRIDAAIVAFGVLRQTTADNSASFDCWLRSFGYRIFEGDSHPGPPLKWRHAGRLDLVRWKHFSRPPILECGRSYSGAVIAELSSAPSNAISQCKMRRRAFLSRVN